MLLVELNCSVHWSASGLRFSSGRLVCVCFFWRGSLCLWCCSVWVPLPVVSPVCVSLPVLSSSLPSSPLLLVVAASLVLAQWMSLCFISCFWASFMKIDGLGAKVRGDILGRGFLQCFFSNIHHFDPPNPAPYCILCLKCMVRKRGRVRVDVYLYCLLDCISSD